MILEHSPKGRSDAAFRGVANGSPLTTVHCKFKDTIRYEGVITQFGGRLCTGFLNISLSS
jgi:hypothetical protein